MAFIVYIESVSNLHTSEKRCKWLSQLLEGRFELPSVEHMFRKTLDEMEIMKKMTRFYKRHCISTFSINHTDDMCEDMGWPSWRKPTWLSEAFSAYGSRGYTEEDIGNLTKKMK